jgi:hypothetical protein
MEIQDRCRLGCGGVRSEAEVGIVCRFDGLRRSRSQKNGEDSPGDRRISANEVQGFVENWSPGFENIAGSEAP